MSKPDIVPKQSVSGIAVDPKTLERVVPESRRSDGSVRKQLKVRPGFLPQEDISRFRGSRQQQFDRNALPKGHILGWIAPSAERKPGAPGKTPGTGAGVVGADQPLTKSAAKNAKRKAKKQAEKDKVIQESWEDSDEEKPAKTNGVEDQRAEDGASQEPEGERKESATADKTKEPVAADGSEGGALAEELEKKLDVH